MLQMTKITMINYKKWFNKKNLIEFSKGAASTLIIATISYLIYLPTKHYLYPEASIQLFIILWCFFTFLFGFIKGAIKQARKS